MIPGSLRTFCIRGLQAKSMINGEFGKRIMSLKNSAQTQRSISHKNIIKYKDATTSYVAHNVSYVIYDTEYLIYTVTYFEGVVNRILNRERYIEFRDGIVLSLS